MFDSMVLGSGIYHVELIDSGIPTAVFTFSYVDYPTGCPWERYALSTSQPVAGMPQALVASRLPGTAICSIP